MPEIAKYTPGPWTTREGVDNYPEWNVRAPGGWLISVVYENCEANARLMAAAPELLEALRQAVEYLEADYDQPDWFAGAEAAIQKATGG